MSQLSTLRFAELKPKFVRICTLTAHSKSCLQGLGSQAFKLPHLLGGCLTKLRGFYILSATTGHICEQRIVTLARG